MSELRRGRSLEPLAVEMASSGASIGRITTGLFRRGGTTGAVLRQRGGMGLPVKHNPPPTEPVRAVQCALRTAAV